MSAQSILKRVTLGHVAKMFRCSCRKRTIQTDIITTESNCASINKNQVPSAYYGTTYLCI